MTKNHTCKWHDCSQLKPYKPGLLRRFIMWMTSEPYDKMVSGEVYIEAGPDFDSMTEVIDCQYTNVYGETNTEEVLIVTWCRRSVVKFKFVKPAVMPDIRENVYLKTNV